MLAIDLKPELEALLIKLAEKSGSTANEEARLAIIERIEDLEDYYDGMEALDEYRKTGIAYSSKEIESELGL